MRLVALGWLGPGLALCSAVGARRAPIGGRFRACSCLRLLERAALAASLALPRVLRCLPRAAAGAAASRLAASLALPLPRWPRLALCTTAAGAGCAAVAAASFACGLVLAAVVLASSCGLATLPAALNWGRRAHGEKPFAGAVSRVSALVAPLRSKASLCKAHPSAKCASARRRRLEPS